jgi:membrane-associated protease RseP (regulator of RpoE activity)
VSQDLQGHFLAWRTVELRDRQVIDALVHPDHAAPSPSLAAALARWPGVAYWSDEPSGRHLILTRPRAAPRERWWLHALLLVATLLTATYAGAILAGALAPGATFGVLWRMSPVAGVAPSLTAGLAYAVALVAILLAHELGHYVTARRARLDASPPYFLPLPTAIGTVGAYIRLRTILNDRRQLLDVAAAGPFAGFCLALPALAWGMAHSIDVPDAAGLHGLLVWFGVHPVQLGDSLLTLGLRQWFHGHTSAMTLHPVAFAGWVGMLVTMLNLIPVSQLDGGHVLYAAAPRWHERISQLAWVGLLVLGWMGWRGWFLWAALVFVVARGRLGHPAVLDPIRPLPRSRRWPAIAALLLFAVTFVPVPFRL